MLTTCLEIEKMTPENLESYICLFHQLNVKRILVDVIDFIELGDERERKLSWIKQVINVLHRDGFEAGIWTNTLGWGNVRAVDFERRFPDSIHIANFSGGGTHAICVLDKPFRKELCRWIADFAGTGADLILLDDDFILSARNALGCACPSHLAMLSERLGRTVTADDLQQAYSGGPNELRNLFLDCQAETILDYVRGLREVADSVNPSARIGLAASYTLFDIEGVDTETMLDILAGKGNRPFLRLSGATYWSKFSSRLLKSQQGIGAVQETVRSNRAYFRNTRIELLDENDSYPREHCIVPSTYVEMYDRITLADGDAGRLKYIVQGPYSTPLDHGGRSYVNAHLRNLPFDDALLKMFSGKVAQGWRVFQARHLIRDAVLPEPFAGEYPIMSWCTQSRAGAFLTGNAQSTSYGEEGNGPVAAFWENARHLTEDMLNAGVLLDAEGARILMEKGVDIGLRSLTPVAVPSGETFQDSGRLASGILERDGVFYRMDIAQEAEVLSTFQSADGDYPACYFYKNAKGQRFAVYSFDANSLDYGTFQRAAVTATYTPGRRAQLNSLYSRLSGNAAAVSAMLDTNPGFTMLARKNGNRLCVMFCNTFDDWLEDTPFKLDQPGRLVQCLNGKAAVNGDVLTLSALRPFDWCAVEIALG